VRREDVQVHGPIRKAFLGEARPASMLMLVAGLPWPDMLIEIRVEAIAA
jgi:enamine deaminase RidA (YjgF/YER057c/UK114 family)